jgi:hypothetical protein
MCTISMSTKERGTEKKCRILTPITNKSMHVGSVLMCQFICMMVSVCRYIFASGTTTVGLILDRDLEIIEIRLSAFL